MTYRTDCCTHPNEWPVIASSDLLYITHAAVFEDDLSFRKGQLAGMNAQSGMMSGRAGARVIPLFYF